MATEARYQQVADEIRREIFTGLRRPGDRLPTEHALGKSHRVSRGTVRRALTELAAEGLVMSTQGSGTYVRAASPMSRFFSLSSFDDEMRAIDRVPTTRVLSAESVSAGEAVSDRLQITPGTPALHIRRLRLADGVPMAIERRILAEHLCPDLLDEDLEHQSIHWLLAVKYAIPLVRVEHTVDREPVAPTDASALGLEPGAPVLVLDRLTFTEDTNGTRRPAVWFRAAHQHLEGGRMT